MLVSTILNSLYRLFIFSPGKISQCRFNRFNHTFIRIHGDCWFIKLHGSGWVVQSCPGFVIPLEFPFPSSIHHPVFLDGCAKGGCRKERFALPVAENALPLCPLGENKTGRDGRVVMMKMGVDDDDDDDDDDCDMSRVVMLSVIVDPQDHDVSVHLHKQTCIYSVFTSELMHI